jgi:hypothetical protein
MGCTSWNEHRSVIISRETDVSALDTALTYGTVLSIKRGWKASLLYPKPLRISAWLRGESKQYETNLSNLRRELYALLMEIDLSCPSTLAPCKCAVIFE